MITIEPQVFYGIVGSILTTVFGAVALAIRQWANTRSYTGRSQADGQLMEDKARAEAMATLARIAEQNFSLQSKGIEVQQNMVDAVREQARVTGEGSAQMRGMVAMLDDHNKVLKNAVIGMDETQVGLSLIKSDVIAIKDVAASLETNLGESIGGSIRNQFAPIIDELRNVGSQISTLVIEIQTKDGHTNTRLTELVILFKDAEKRFMTMLEPLVIKHIAEFIPVENANNGTEKEQTP